MFKSVTEAFEWMVSFTNFEKKPDLTKRGYRLDKMEKLLEIFGNPQNSYKIVHVAGSKGKGSTSAFIGSILNQAGYRTGIYASPHLLDYRERITENHNFFSSETYISVIFSIKERLSLMDFSIFPGGEPTTFELMTLAAFLIFKEENCSWVVVETGLGGRLDATNVVTPVASVITSIELEHTDILGDTYEKIAAEKAGIIKRGIPVFSSNSKKEVVSVLNSFAEKMSSYIEFIPDNFYCDITKEGSILHYNGNSYTLGLSGRIQALNALTAIITIKKILPEVSEVTISEGLKKCLLSGRFHLINKKPYTIVDGAHTRISVEETVKNFKHIYGEGCIIFGAISGKDIKSMVNTIENNFTDIIVSTPGTFKESNIDSIVKEFSKRSVVKLENPSDAYNYAISLKKPVLVTGSFYMAGEIAKLVIENEKS